MIYILFCQIVNSFFTWKETLKFPGIESVKCFCAGKKHTFVATRNKPVCGCIGPGFIQKAKRNHLTVH